MTDPVAGVPRLADQDARDLAVSEFSRPLQLEAGAGTGKTRSLVARLATWMLGPGWRLAAEELAGRNAPIGGATSPAEIAARVAEGTVAITFTDAAAAEMSRRLGELLAALAAGRSTGELDPLPNPLAEIDVRPRAQALTSVLSRLRLQTIHGFCHRLLADHPFEAGLHPTLVVDAEGEELNAAASEVLIERLRIGQPEVIALIRSGVAPATLHRALVDLVTGGARKEDLAVDPWDDAACDLLRSDAASRLEEFLDKLEPLAAQAKRVSTLARAVEALRSLLEELAAGSGRTAIARISEVGPTLAADGSKLFERYAKSGLGKTEAELLGSEAAAYLDFAQAAREAVAELFAVDPERFEVARRALGPMVEQVRYRLDRAGILTFDDLLDRASELLQRNATVRRRLRREIRQILVDEFQDTDRRQCELLAALAFAEREDEPGPGLFIVGDPKQSIYAWRKADLASYEGFLERMQAAGGASARLSVNFRSVPAVLDEVTRTVAPVMLPEPAVQPQFEPLSPSPKLAGAPGFLDPGRRPVEYWVSWDPTDLARGERTKASRANTLEAAAIARDIRSLHDGARKPWGAFAILLRARKSLDVYLEALRRAGIPYAVQRDRSYYRRREVIDLACAVRAILDPSDLLALVAFLRSPLVGVPDAAWIPLWRAGFASAMVELERTGGLAEALRAVADAALETRLAGPGRETLRGWPQALSAAVRTVFRLRAEFRSLPAAEWIERLRAWLLPEPLAAARYLGRFGLANVERLLARLERELEKETDPHRALARLQRAVEEVKDAEDARPPELSRDAVSVMTIHTAKGLEYEQVYLAQIHREHRARRESSGTSFGGPSAVVDSPRLGARHELLLLGLPSPGYRAAERLRQRSQQAEMVRLLYVALTRAKERLVVCGNWPANAAAVEADRARSWVELLADRRSENLAQLRDTVEVHDAAGVPWRLAAQIAPSESLPSERSHAGEVPSAVEPTSVAPAPTVPAPEGVTTVERLEARRRASRLAVERASNLAAAPSQHEAPDPLDDEAPSRSFALALGTALHRALELEELAERDAESWRATVVGAFERELPEATDGDLRVLATEIDRLGGSELLRRLRALRSHVEARELPLLTGLPPGLAESPEAPLAGVVGTLDLLYVDPATGETVVADFKTDDLPDEAIEAALASKLERYRPQLELYGEAVSRALALARPPRLELWMLSVDRIATLPPRP